MGSGGAENENPPKERAEARKRRSGPAGSDKRARDRSCASREVSAPLTAHGSRKYRSGREKKDKGEDRRVKPRSEAGRRPESGEEGQAEGGYGGNGQHRERGSPTAKSPPTGARCRERQAARQGKQGESSLRGVAMKAGRISSTNRTRPHVERVAWRWTRLTEPPQKAERPLRTAGSCGGMRTEAEVTRRVQQDGGPRITPGWLSPGKEGVMKQGQSMVRKMEKQRVGGRDQAGTGPRGPGPEKAPSPWTGAGTRQARWGLRLAAVASESREAVQAQRGGRCGRGHAACVRAQHSGQRGPPPGEERHGAPGARPTHQPGEASRRISSQSNPGGAHSRRPGPGRPGQRVHGGGRAGVIGMPRGRARAGQRPQQQPGSGPAPTDPRRRGDEARRRPRPTWGRGARRRKSAADRQRGRCPGRGQSSEARQARSGARVSARPPTAMAARGEGRGCWGPQSLRRGPVCQKQQPRGPKARQCGKRRRKLQAWRIGGRHRAGGHQQTRPLRAGAAGPKPAQVASPAGRQAGRSNGTAHCAKAAATASRGRGRKGDGPQCRGQAGAAGLQQAGHRSAAGKPHHAQLRDGPVCGLAAGRKQAPSAGWRGVPGPGRVAAPSAPGNGQLAKRKQAGRPQRWTSPSRRRQRGLTDPAGRRNTTSPRSRRSAGRGQGQRRAREKPSRQTANKRPGGKSQAAAAGAGEPAAQGIPRDSTREGAKGGAKQAGQRGPVARRRKEQAVELSATKQPRAARKVVEEAFRGKRSARPKPLRPPAARDNRGPGQERAADRRRVKQRQRRRNGRAGLA